MHEEAMKDYTNFVEKEYYDPDLLCKKAVILWEKLGKVDEALAAFNKSIEKYPWHKKTYILKGRIVHMCLNKIKRKTTNANEPILTSCRNI